MKEERLKRYRQSVKQLGTKQNIPKQDIPKQRKEFYQQICGDDTETYQQLDARKLDNFGIKYWNQENIKKTDWISNIAKDLEGLEGKTTLIQKDPIKGNGLKTTDQ